MMCMVNESSNKVVIHIVLHMLLTVGGHQQSLAGAVKGSCSPSECFSYYFGDSGPKFLDTGASSSNDCSCNFGSANNAPLKHMESPRISPKHGQTSSRPLSDDVDIVIVDGSRGTMDMDNIDLKVSDNIGDNGAASRAGEGDGYGAVVLYSPKILQPFHLASRTFHLAGRDFSIKQNWADFGVAAVVWDAALVLCEYLEAQSRDGSLSLKGKRVIELGAGTGLVGMVAATLHGTTTVTDRESVLQPLEENINLNFSPPSQMETSSSSFSSSTDPKPVVQALDWGKNHRDFPGPYDVILGADIIYIEESFPALLLTLDYLSNKETVVLLSCRIRYERDEQFLASLKELFEVRQVLRDQKRGIQIYSAQKTDKS